MPPVLPSGGLLLLAASPLALLLPRSWLRVAGPAAMLALIAWHWAAADGGGAWVLEFAGFELLPSVSRPAGRLLGLVFSFFGFCAFLYLWPAGKDRVYHFAAFLYIGASLALPQVGDLFSFFILWEAITLGAVLAIWRDSGATELPVRYFLFQMLGATALFIGIGLHYGASGSLRLESLLGGGGAPRGAFVLAVMVKAAAIPFHLWLVGIYPRVSAETAVLLSAYATKVGVFSVSLLLPGLRLELAGAALALAAVLYALRQQELRTLLSWHVISQVGFMISGLGGASPLAQAGGHYHIAGNVLFKGLLFMAAGALGGSFGTGDLGRLGGAGRRRPLVLVAALFGAAAISGLPPLNGYASKALLKLGGTGPLPAALLVAASVGTAFSFAKVLYYGFFQGLFRRRAPQSGSGAPPPPPPPARPAGRLHPAPAAAMLLLSAACLLTGLAPGLLLERFLGVRVGLFGPLALWSGLWPIVLAVSLFLLLRRPVIRLAALLTPERLGLGPALLRAAGGGLQALQRLHNGSLRRYLFWVAGGLILLWGWLSVF